MNPYYLEKQGMQIEFRNKKDLLTKLCRHSVTICMFRNSSSIIPDPQLKLVSPQESKASVASGTIKHYAFPQMLPILEFRNSLYKLGRQLYVVPYQLCLTCNVIASLGIPVYLF